MAGIYDYINRFWAEAERSPFNPTEVALYHYLLYEANRLRWNMPFACHTAILCVRLSTTKQNISKARQHLKERGLIDCQVGTGIHTPALYSLTIQPFRQLPHQVTRQLTHELTVQLPHSNIKDKDKDIINSQHAQKDGYKPLDEIEALADQARNAWQLGMNPIGDLTDTLEGLGLLVIVVDEEHPVVKTQRDAKNTAIYTLIRKKTSPSKCMRLTSHLLKSIVLTSGHRANKKITI